VSKKQRLGPADAAADQGRILVEQVIDTAPKLQAIAARKVSVIVATGVTAGR
jgi:hypothetical protein